MYLAVFALDIDLNIPRYDDTVLAQDKWTKCLPDAGKEPLVTDGMIITKVQVSSGSQEHLKQLTPRERSGHTLLKR